MNKTTFLLLSTLLISLNGTANAQSTELMKNLIDSAVINDINKFALTDIVLQSIKNQNTKYGNMSSEKILELDKKWRAETKSTDQPLISATLTNPLSSYLTRIQAHAKGLYTEIFVMDTNGLNVGQSNISSDYWQGDEAKFQKTYSVSPTAVFIDTPEYNSELGVWLTQANLSIANEQNKAIGAITVEINLTELQRRKNLNK